MRNVRGTGLFASLTGLLLISGALIGASAASADQVQVQSYQRATQGQACSAQPGETPWQASWGSDSSWTPSWEQWANGGKGGWTCTRSITWAHDESTPVIQCTQESQSSYVLLDPSGFIPFDAQTYYNATCTDPGYIAGNQPYGYAFTSNGPDAATAICRTGNSLAYLIALLVDGNLYFCVAVPG